MYMHSHFSGTEPLKPDQKDSAGEQLYLLHAAVILAYIRLHISSEEDAEDLRPFSTGPRSRLIRWPPGGQLSHALEPLSSRYSYLFQFYDELAGRVQPPLALTAKPPLGCFGERSE